MDIKYVAAQSPAPYLPDIIIKLDSPEQMLGSWGWSGEIWQATR